jgi:RND family efflux transporter MFP subunit
MYRPRLSCTWLRHWADTVLLVCLTLFAGPFGSASAQSVSPELDCVIEPQQVVKLASSVVGVIARLDVDRGDIVAKGQVLGSLEDGVEAATLALAKAKATNEHTIKSLAARLDYLRNKFGRAGQLGAKSFTSQAAVQEAESDAKMAEEQMKEAILNLEIARLDVTRSEELLRQRRFISPIDGVVMERTLVPGEYRNEQTPIMTLAQIDPLRVEVFVPLTHYRRITIGSTARVKPDNPIGGVYTATVTVVDQVFDAASGTFGVRLKLPNPELRLPAGIRCKILFELAEKAG